MSIVNEKMTALADAIREKSNRSDTLTLDEMTVAVRGIGGGTSSGEKVDYSENEDAIITKTLITYINDRVKSIGSQVFSGCGTLTTISFSQCSTINEGAFHNCINLTTASFPACTTIGSLAFRGCGNLTTISFPACTTIGSQAFFICRNLTTISFPACTTIGSLAFHNCGNLTTASFPACTTINREAFGGCQRLSNLYLTGSSVCQLLSSTVFESTPFMGYPTYFSGTPHIYVPASLVNAYKTATNWMYFSEYISAYEDIQSGYVGGAD